MENITIRCRLNDEIKQKLKFVKIVKFNSGLGLKQSKEVLDKMLLNFADGNNLYTDINIYNEKFKFDKLQNELSDNDMPIDLIGDTKWLREVKLASLVGESEDIIKIINELLSFNSNIKDNIISILLNKLNREDLVEILDKVTKELI